MLNQNICCKKGTSRAHLDFSSIMAQVMLGGKKNLRRVSQAVVEIIL